MKKVLILIILAFGFVNLKAEYTKYCIKIKLKGCKEKKLLLANYYGNSFQIVDTAVVLNEVATFQGNRSLTKGVYTIANMKKSKYFDFIIDNEFDVHISTNLQSVIDSAQVLKSDENKEFFDFMKLNSKLFYLNKKINNSKNDQSRIQELKDYKNEVEIKVNLFKNKVMKEKPSSLLAVIFNVMKDPPSLPKSENQMKRYRYFKSNYWNTIDLSDERILKTPVFHKKFDTYFDKVIYQHTDTLIKEVDLFLQKQHFNDEVKKYLAWNLLVKYEYPKIMGQDKIFVHVFNNYYKKNLIPNISQSVYTYIEERANTLESLLIGAVAPEMVLLDTLGVYIDIKKASKKQYSVLFFWDFDCKLCQKEIKSLNKLFYDKREELDIIAVCTVNELKKWKKASAEYNREWIHVNGTRSAKGDYHDLYDIHTTPTIYLLDKNKRIIAKRLAASQLEEFIKNYEYSSTSYDKK